MSRFRRSPEQIGFNPQEKRIDQSQFFERIRLIVENFINSHSRMTINIAGQSAVGKSTISEKIIQMFGESAKVVRIDDYLLGWDVGILNHDSDIPDKPYFAGLNPRVYDLDRFKSDLQKLHAGLAIDMPWFNEITKRRGGFVPFSPSPIMVIDGIYALDGEFNSYADLSLLIEAPLHDRLIRKILRNSTETLESVNSIIATYLTRDEPAYSYHVDRLIAAADWVVSNPIQPNQEFNIGSQFEQQSPDKPFQNINILVVPKPQYGKLRETEDLAVVSTNQEIFIQYYFGGKCLFFAPIDKTTLDYMNRYYEFHEVR